MTKFHDIFNNVVFTKIKCISLKANAIECENRFAFFLHLLVLIDYSYQRRISISKSWIHFDFLVWNVSFDRDSNYYI